MSEQKEHKWCVSADKTQFTEEFLTREEAIAYGRIEYEEHRVFHIAKCKVASKRVLYPDADEIGDSIANAAFDNYGEFAEEFEVEIPPEAMEEIYKILDKHVDEPNFWDVWDVETIEDVEAESDA